MFHGANPAWAGSFGARGRADADPAPLRLSAGPAYTLTAPGPFATALAAVGVHTAAILAVTGAVAVAAFGWAALRSALSLVWT